MFVGNTSGADGSGSESVLLLLRFIYPFVVLFFTIHFSVKQQVKTMLSVQLRKAIFTLMIFFMVCLAVAMFSDYAMISIMKLVQFVYIVLILSFTLWVIPVPFSKWTRFLSSVWIAVVIASIPFIILPGGYIGNNLFRGVLNHSQVLGPFLAIGLSILLPRVLKANVIKENILFCIAVWILLATQSRTAMLLVVTSQVITWCVMWIKSLSLGAKDCDHLFYWKKKEVMVKILFVIIGIYLTVFVLWDALSEYAIQKLMKTDTVSSFSMEELNESGLHSRSGQIQSFKDAIVTHPLFGNGFGLPYGDMEIGNISYIPGTSIPIGATVEVGFIMLALFAQIGIVGSFIFLYFLFLYLKPIFSENSEVILLGITPLLSNFGEGTLFSPSTLLGMSTWFCLILCAVYRKKTVNSKVIIK
jgi:hypothetical protein